MKLTRWLLALLVLGAMVPAIAHAEGRCGSHPWCNTALSPDQRATLLEDAMSQSDKVAMLTAGSASDVGVPALSFDDGALGVRTTSQPGEPATAFPAGIALAANFSQSAARSYGAAVGVEIRDHGYDGDWGPTVNMMRTPLGGRTYEAYGEDPFLTAQTAVGWIDGFQSEGVMATVKHFIENDQEGQLGESPISGADGGRLITNVIVDERTLHEIELRPFAAAVQQAHVATVMCAYNQVNGEFSCDNPTLLQTILRGQLGFQGIIMSDLGAAHSPQADLNAGMDWDIAGNSDNAEEVDLALADGEVSQATLDARVHEYLRTLFAYGFVDRAGYPNDPAAVPRAHDTAVDIATEEGGATLLKNDGVLPLTGRDRRIAVIGLPAENYVFGFGSSQVTPYQTVDMLQGIEARAKQAGDTVTYDTGSDLAQAEADAKAANVAIVVAADSESEGDDKQCMSLAPQCAPTQESTITPDDPSDAQLAWGDQDSLISDIAAVNPHTVGLLETGAPVLTPWRGALAGLLEAWYPGEDGGTAVAHVLWGDVDPGGRLPATFPASYSQEPTAGSTSSYPGVLNPDYEPDAANGALYKETYNEGVFVGYRWFDAHDLTPAYPFGFGLSYTTFKLSNLKAARSQAEVTVRNTGARTGIAVPEVYLGLPSTSAVPEPPAQLAGYDKITLAPGRSVRVKIPLQARSFQYWNTAASAWATMPGCVKVMAGLSSSDLPLENTLADGGAHCAPPARPGCPAPTGKLSGRALGPITLGETRARLRRGLRRNDDRRARYTDVFCFTPIGIRVGFPPPAAAKRLARATRRATAGRAVLILTANRYYALRGVHPGATLASAEHAVRLERPTQTGVNTWYLSPMAGVTGVLKVRRGIVEEIGIANQHFTAPRSVAVRFLSSF
jgi:beta-glucosidase